MTDKPSLGRPTLAAIALAFLAGCGTLGYQVLPEADDAKRRQAAANLNTVRMALEQFGTDYNGTYPDPASVQRSLEHGQETGPPLPANYLPSNRMPRNPWGDAAMPMVGATSGFKWPKNLNAIQAIADGQATLSPVGTVLGPGHMPGDGPTDALTYGAVIYAYQPYNQIYVAYVIGRQGDMAVIAGGTSNSSC